MTPEDLQEGISILEKLIFAYVIEDQTIISAAIKEGELTGEAATKILELRKDFVDTLGMETEAVFHLINGLGIKAGLALVAVAAKAQHEISKEALKS